MGIVDKVKKVIDWKPPSSRESGVTSDEKAMNANDVAKPEKINKVAHGAFC